MATKTKDEELKTAWAEVDRALLERDEAIAERDAAHQALDAAEETVESLIQDLAEAEGALRIMYDYARTIAGAADAAAEALDKNAED